VRGARFEWHGAKAASNQHKHGVSFTAAAAAFDDPDSITIEDPDHSSEEDRFVLLGKDAFGRILVVVHTFRGDTSRIIGARIAPARERRHYLDGR
jgi:uncharacterized DUF497 family protein